MKEDRVNEGQIFHVLSLGNSIYGHFHKIGANLYSNLAFAPFCAKKYGPGWVGGRACLRIAYSYQKYHNRQKKQC